MLSDHFEKLKHFRAVAKEGSFLGGGRVVNQTQQTVFYSVNRLEEVLECKLFVRSRKGVRLTEIGKYLLEETNHLESEIKRIERNMNQMKGAPFKITLGVNLLRFSSVVAPSFQALKKIGDGLEINPVLIESSSKMMDAVNKGLIDVAIVAGTDLFPNSSIEDIPLLKDEYKLCKSTSWSLGQKTRLTRLDLDTRGVLFLSNSVSAAHQDLGSELKVLGYPRSKLRLYSFEAIKQLVIHDKYIGLLPATMIRSETSLGILEQVEPPKGMTPGSIQIRMIYRSDAGLRMTANCMRDILLAQ